jgi:hypothetical protein
MSVFLLPADDTDLLLFLDRFRVMILGWADILDVTEAEYRAVDDDYWRLNRVLKPFRSHNTEMCERYGRYAVETSIRGALPGVRERLTSLIARIESHPCYSAAAATDLRLITDPRTLDLVFHSGDDARSQDHIAIRKVPRKH